MLVKKNNIVLRTFLMLSAFAHFTNLLVKWASLVTIIDNGKIEKFVVIILPSSTLIGAMTFSTTTLSTTTFGITTLSLKGLICDTHHNNTVSSAILLSVIMLCVEFHLSLY